MRWTNGATMTAELGSSLNACGSWPTPEAIVSDGAYGVGGFEGDPLDPVGLPEWYAPHIAAWSRAAAPSTTLWFWNTEIGWATMHPELLRAGWRYVGLSVWDKGRGHVAGNVNTATIRRFPTVTEVCAQYERDVMIEGITLRAWLLREWRRTGLPLRVANEACGVADAATRKYLEQGRLWYFPPPDKFDLLAAHANAHGNPAGRPYFAVGGRTITGAEWARYRPIFHCPFGVTNVWSRGALRDDERVRDAGGEVAHPCQKPLDLTELIVAASTDPGGVVWEPFGGLFTATLAAHRTGRRGYGAEVSSVHYRRGIARLIRAGRAHKAAKST